MVRSLCIALVFLSLSGCNRPLESNADPTGTERLPLRGEAERIALLLRDVHTPQGIFPQGTRLSVWETWLLRKEPRAKPPGYRVSGLYDPSAQNKGFVLPRGTIHVYFYGPPLDDNFPRTPVAIPQEAVRIETKKAAVDLKLPTPARADQ